MEGEEYDYEYDNSSSNYSLNYGDYYTVCDKQEVRSFARFFLPAAYALALVTGVAGNTLVVAVYASPGRLRTLSDACVLNLGVADLLLLLTLPLWAADAVRGWELGVAACKVASALYAVNFSSGMFFLACISVDRCRALAGPRARARRQCLLVCLGVWSAACLLGLPDAFYSTVKHGSARKSCVAIYPPGMAWPTKAVLELVEVGLSFLLPFVVMAVCYTRVGCALQRMPQARHGRRWRTLLVVVGVFLITQLPYNVVKFIRAADATYALFTECESSKSLDRALQVTEALALMHCCLNPVLYASVGTSFRAHLLRAAKRFSRRRRDYRHGSQGGTVEIPLSTCSTTHTHTHTQSEEDTTTFTL